MAEQIENIRGESGHGGNIYRLAEKLGIQERKVVDFSASVNPLGVSKQIKAEIRRHLKYLPHYPDPEAKKLRKRLAQYHGINPETILCGNGSTELIYLITRALKPRKVLIPVPTFSEYERAVLTAENKERRAVIEFYILKEKNGFEINPDEFITDLKGERDPSPIAPHSSHSFDMAFLCNPNNPTGRLLRREDVIKIAGAARDLRCYLIVDEAFMDFCPEETIIKYVESNPYLIVLRSMTNFYALAGLRIGYGVFPQDLVERLKGYKEPWTVSSLAQRAAAVAIRDKTYKKETFTLLRQEKRFLEKNIKKLGIEFFPSDTNFYLLKISNADEISDGLQLKGMLVRDCSDFRGLDRTYLRISVKSHKENAILIKELTQIIQKQKTNTENPDSDRINK